MTIFRFLSLLLLVCSLHGAELPAIPESNRVLTSDEVKNYWLNAIPKMELPAKGNGLHPEQQAKRERKIEQRKTLMREIKSGKYDVDAKLASLSHNVVAHTQLGETDKAKMSEERLYLLREHLSKLATLKAQRDIAEKLSEATDQIASLKAEISSLEQTINSQTCSNDCD
ncbi:hypothetical protein [Haloferula sp.]|uniref:hypothetical protein n=1 Tax=Haloferula sp. TaxID=2497595 RepID=UPI00329F66C1